jgi:hypothetical protein
MKNITQDGRHPGQGSHHECMPKVLPLEPTCLVASKQPLIPPPPTQNMHKYTAISSDICFVFNVISFTTSTQLNSFSGEQETKIRGTELTP